MADDGSVVLDGASVDILLAGPSGPVVQDLSRKAIAVTGRAKRLCPVNTGRLRSSIRWGLKRDHRGIFAEAGTDVEYAAAVHNGTAPHEIRPVRARVLHFTVNGAHVFTNRVWHPGTRGVPFLTDALRQELR